MIYFDIMQTYWIDSRDRVNNTTSDTGQFDYTLPEVFQNLKGINRVGLTMMILPLTWYNIKDNFNNSLPVTVNSGPDAGSSTIVIGPEGIYNRMSQVASLLQTKLQAAFPSSSFTAVYNKRLDQVEVESDYEYVFDFSSTSTVPVKDLLGFEELSYTATLSGGKYHLNSAIHPQLLPEYLAVKIDSETPGRRSIRDKQRSHSFIVPVIGEPGKGNIIYKSALPDVGEFIFDVSNRDTLSLLKISITDSYENVIDLRGGHLNMQIVISP